MNTALLWIEATRPKTLIAIISPVMIGSAMAYGSHNFSVSIFLWTFLAGLSLQIGTNFSNDFFDIFHRSTTLSCMHCNFLNLHSLYWACCIMLEEDFFERFFFLEGMVYARTAQGLGSGDFICAQFRGVKVEKRGGI